jgi:PBP1b-binding outer membrane lipoprotein LpoB
MKKLLLFLFAVILLCVGCSKKIFTESEKVTDKTSVSQNYVSRDYVEKVKQQTIDSMLKVQLPVEHSAMISAKPHQVSHLKTSLALSDAYVDSGGYLNHTLYNRDSAYLPVKYIISNILITKHDTINRHDTIQIKETAKTNTVIQKQKLFENFFYYSGFWLYVIIIIYIAFKCLSNGYLTIVWQFLRKLFKKK